MFELVEEINNGANIRVIGVGEIRNDEGDRVGFFSS